MTDFVRASRRKMEGFITKSIDDLLEVLDSEIVFPYSNNGNVVFNKLLTIVQGREEVWKAANELMDMAQIDRSGDHVYKERIIKSFQTTWHEMTKIVTMDIKDAVQDDEDEGERGRNSITDDKLSSISKAKVLAAKMAYQILDRISLLENPDDFNEQLMKNNMQMASIVEEYAQR